MSDTNKVKYGLKNVHYAKGVIAPDGSATYQKPKRWPGAVSLTQDAQGGTTKFRADNITYWTGQSNNGYEGDLETAQIPDDFREDILGDIRDANGILVENAEAPTVIFALLFEFAGDKRNTRHVMYNCTATRPSVTGKTTEEEITPETETVTITAASVYNSALNKNIVKAKATPDEAPYAGWYDNVYQSTSSALVDAVGLAAESQSASLYEVSVADIQGSDVKVEGRAITGTLKYLPEGNAITNVWGPGNFVALKFNATDWSKYTSVKVGLDPSQGSGLVEIKDDLDKNGVFKVTNKETQVFEIVATDGTYTRVDRYSLAGLTLETA